MEVPMADSGRARRLAERIQQIVARMLDTRIKDPRLGFVTVTDVRVTGDLQHATVFYTVYGSDEDRAGTAAALRSATGIIRSEVGKQTGVRLTPTLEFVLDALPATAQDLADRLAEVKLRDEQIAAAAAGATYAGEADPYKASREESDDDELDDEAIGDGRDDVSAGVGEDDNAHDDDTPAAPARSGEDLEVVGEIDGDEDVYRSPDVDGPAAHPFDAAAESAPGDGAGSTDGAGSPDATDAPGSPDAPGTGRD
ncbi:30S ribosome-binding factor RbfA [Georgenia sp. Z1344]|uniref:30S ribosome-binding factor RbfA n=1 Tax=Georgenia sp. Z1344 TaxID=3416706 RepID=UPI003CF732CF